MAIYLGAGALNQQLADRQNVIKEAAASRMYGAERVRQDFVGLGQSAIDLVKNYGVPEWMGGAGKGAQHVAYAKDMYGTQRQGEADKRDERQLAMYEQSNHIKNLVSSIELDNKLMKSNYYKGQKPATLLEFYKKVQAAHQNEVGTISSLRLMDKYKGMYSEATLKKLTEYRTQFAGNPGGEPLSGNTEALTYLQNLAGQTITDQEEWYKNNGLVNENAMLKESAYIPVLRNYLSKVLGMPMPEVQIQPEARLASLGGHTDQSIFDEEKARRLMEAERKKREEDAAKKAAKEETTSAEDSGVVEPSAFDQISTYIKEALNIDDEVTVTVPTGREAYEGGSIITGGDEDRTVPLTVDQKWDDLREERNEPSITYTGLGLHEGSAPHSADTTGAESIIEGSAKINEAVRVALPEHLRKLFKSRNTKALLAPAARIAINRAEKAAKMKEEAEKRAEALRLRKIQDEKDADRLRQRIVPSEPYESPPGLAGKITFRDDLKKVYDDLMDLSIPYDSSKYNNIERPKAARILRNQLRSARADVRALEDKTLIQDGSQTISMQRYEKQLKDIDKELGGMRDVDFWGREVRREEMTLPQKINEKRIFLEKRQELEDERDKLTRKYEKAEGLAKEAGIQFTGNELNISSSAPVQQIQNSTFEDGVTASTMTFEGNGNANNPGMPYQDAGGLFILAGGLNLAGHVEHWSSGRKDGVVELAYPQSTMPEKLPQAVALRKYLNLKQPALKSGSAQGWEWTKDSGLKLETEPRAILTRFMLNEGALGMIRTTPKLAKTQGDTILNQQIAPNLRHFLKDMSIRFGPAWLKSSETPWAEAFRKELEIYLGHVGKGPGQSEARYLAKIKMISAFTDTPTYKDEIDTPRQKKLLKLLQDMKTLE